MLPKPVMTPVATTLFMPDMEELEPDPPPPHDMAKAATMTAMKKFRILIMANSLSLTGPPVGREQLPLKQVSNLTRDRAPNTRCRQTAASRDESGTRARPHSAATGDRCQLAFFSSAGIEPGHGRGELCLQLERSAEQSQHIH